MPRPKAEANLVRDYINRRFIMAEIIIKSKGKKYCRASSIQVPDDVVGKDNILIVNHELKQYAICNDLQGYINKSASSCRTQRKKTKLMDLLTAEETMFEHVDDINQIDQELYMNYYTKLKISDTQYTDIRSQIYPTAMKHIYSTGIYMIYNKTLNKAYIGMTNDSFISRWHGHQYSKSLPIEFLNHKDTYYYIIKHGITDYHELLIEESNMINHYLKLNKIKLLNKNTDIHFNK